MKILKDYVLKCEAERIANGMTEDQYEEMCNEIDSETEGEA